MFIRSFIARYTIFFITLFIIGSSQAFVITLQDSDDIDQVFSSYEIPEKIIEQVDYTSDVLVGRDEFDYLTELRPSVVLTQQTMKKACMYLFAKKKFKQIILTLDATRHGYSIFFALEAHWTFSKVTVTGIMFGKERYAALYGMDFGEVFETIKHTHVIKKILDLLRSEGYFNAKIQSFFSYDVATKSVTVRLHIVRGKQFNCGTVDVRVTCDEVMHNEAFLSATLRSLFTRKLCKSLYHKNKLENIACRMTAYLEQEGYAQSMINITEKVCHKTNTVSVVYTIVIGSYRQFVFFGNSFFSKKKLLDRITQLGKSAWIVPASLLAQEIAQIYKDKGFFYSTVEAQEEKNKCIFLINEGFRQTISRIDIKHSNAYAPDYLVKKFFKRTIKKRYFDYETFNRERNDLCDFYIKSGYLDVQVADYSFSDISPKESILILSLHEGERYTVASTTIKGCQDIAGSPFVQSSVYLTNDFLVDQRARIQEQCKVLMKRECSARPEIKKNDNASVVLEWNVRPVYVPKNFGKTVLLGAVDIPFTNIMKEPFFRSDTSWDNTLLRSTFTRFQSLNVFDTVFLSSQKLKSTVGAADDDYIALQLRYDDPYEIRLKTGFEFQNVSYNRLFGEKMGYKLGGAFMMKNIFPRCSVIQCTMDFTRFHHECALEYRYPWVFGVPLPSTIKGYITKYDQPAFVGSKDTLYTAYNNGLLCAIGNKNGLIDWNVNFGFDWAKTDISDDNCDTRDCFFRIARAINFKPSLLRVFIPYFFVEPTVYIDCLDDKIYPKKGLLTMVSLKSMVPLSYDKRPSYFVKILVEQSFFWPLRNIVGALRIRLGHIFHEDFSRVMPAQRFYLGGVESLRGYDRDMAPPLGVYTDDADKINIVPRGSKSMVNINAELRFSVSKKWGGVVFHDFGTLGDYFKAHITKGNILMATGVGIRYDTPVGPLRFDIGWKWYRKHSLEKSFGWYLTIGNAF